MAPQAGIPSGPPGAASQAPPPVTLAPPEPNNTIYVNNLPEKGKKVELEKKLRSIFSQFGKILQIVCMKSFARKGQAFIVFDSPENATKAFQMQGFSLDDKAMRIAFARAKSDVVAKKDGTYKPREKKPLPPKRTPPASARPQESFVAKRTRHAEAADTGDAMEMDGGPPPRPATNSEAPPNSILFLTKLPDDTTEDLLSRLFCQFPGFKEVRLVPGRSDIAFVEYDSEIQAAEAKAKLQGFKVKPTHPLSIVFAKK